MRVSLAALSLLALVLLPSPGRAVPRFSLRTGAPCGLCHVDPTGGGMRNDYGRNVYAVDRLPLKGVGLPEGAPPFDGRVSGALALGSDVRLLYQHIERPDASQPRIDSFYLMEASLYAAADLWDVVTLYLAPSFYGSESVYFEANGVFHIPWAGMYVKLGQFTAPYGLKIPNHSSFFRKSMGFNVRDKEVGVELGINPGPVTFQVAAFNGISDAVDSDWDENFLKGVSARLSYILNTRWLKMELGASGYYNMAGNAPEDDPSGEDTRVEDLKAGGFAGLSLGRFTWLGEMDYWRRDDRSAAFPVGQLFSYQELAFLAIQGLDILFTYELWDPDVEVSGDAVHRVGGGLELYVWPYSEVDLMYRYSLADERNDMANVHEAIVVAHFFF